MKNIYGNIDAKNDLFLRCERRERIQFLDIRGALKVRFKMKNKYFVEDLIAADSLLQNHPLHF